MEEEKKNKEQETPSIVLQVYSECKDTIFMYTAPDGSPCPMLMFSVPKNASHVLVPLHYKFPGVSGDFFPLRPNAILPKSLWKDAQKRLQRTEFPKFSARFPEDAHDLEKKLQDNCPIFLGSRMAPIVDMTSPIYLFTVVERSLLVFNGPGNAPAEPRLVFSGPGNNIYVLAKPGADLLKVEGDFVPLSGNAYLLKDAWKKANKRYTRGKIPPLTVTCNSANCSEIADVRNNSITLVSSRSPWIPFV